MKRGYLLYYTLLVVVALGAFINAICVVNGNLKALVPFGICAAATIVLARKVDGYER